MLPSLTSRNVSPWSCTSQIASGIVYTINIYTNVHVIIFADKESEKKLTPVGIHSFSIGSTHAFAVLDNAVTEDRIAEGDKTSEVVVVHGRDVFAWGQNTYYQLLTGKRINRTEPVHALPLDSDKLIPAAAAVAAIAKGGKSEAPSSSDLDATNRLQLMPSLPRKAADGSVKIMEVKIVAGNGLSGVYCGEGSVTPTITPSK